MGSLFLVLKIMKIFLPGLFLLTFVSCSVESEKYSPDRYFSSKDKEALLWIMIRYLGKAPEGVSLDDRFNVSYDSSYLEQMKLMSIDAWYKNGNTHFFMVSKTAASLVDKRVATGGKLVFEDEGGLKEYEEVFRTWKMVPDTLKKRSMLLFDKMVQNESLKEFETRYSQGVDYIEFPDESTYYDRKERAWKIKLTN